MSSQLFKKKPLHVLLEELNGESRLRRILGPLNLTGLGVGAIIGTGIFVLTGLGAHIAGPSLMLSLVVSGLACLFSALCYSEFAAMVPVAGSAYTYAYATLGELFAWIIGWDLILEYAVAASTVAQGWSHYFQKLFEMVFKTPFPKSFGWPPLQYNPGTVLTSSGSIFNLPAVVIALVITIILVKGIRETANFNTTMVILKLAVIFLVIGVGIFYINPANWKPFAPHGLVGLTLFGKTLFGQTDASGAPLGMMAGAALIFFAYIGFDSISTHAEEAKNPRKDVPIAIISSLLICTVLYILVAGVLTGMVPYDKIDKTAPVAVAFMQVGLGWANVLITFGALAGITSVLLVMMLSQPRIFLAMARDGLLPPKIFGAVHEKYRTPWKSTILTGIFIAILSSVLPLEILAQLVNIGTLLAFLIVCGSVLVMRKTHPNAERPFKTPFYPFVPIMGVLLCLVLMLSLPPENWLRLIIWLGIGFIIYFAYSRKHSHLRNEIKENKD